MSLLCAMYLYVRHLRLIIRILTLQTTQVQHDLKLKTGEFIWLTTDTSLYVTVAVKIHDSGVAGNRSNMNAKQGF